MTKIWMTGVAVCATALAAPKVTFNRDVAPILQKNCQGCHRPGEAAPMSLLRYTDARPWAKAMKEAVLSKRMPPWHADPHYGKFSNDRSMSEAEIRTIAAWVDAGAPEGNPKHLPKPVAFVEGWNIGKPDVEIEMPKEHAVPASGTIEYQYFVIPTDFKEDRWISAAEVRPGNREVVHHVIAFIREPGSKWLSAAKPGEAFVPRARREQRPAQPAQPGQSRREEQQGMLFGGEYIVGYAPGAVPEVFEPGRAKLLKAGSDVVLQMHYTTNGKAATDRSKIGLTFAKEPPKERVSIMAAATNKFTIPAGDSNHQVDAKVTLKSDAILTDLFPHMHLRGKAFEYRVVWPSGEKETLLKVPAYNFNWQLTYRLAKPMLLPKGTTIEATAWYDNSANNPSNPDATKDVKWGDQSWEEMMIGFFNVAFDAKMDPKLLWRDKKPATSD